MIPTYEEELEKHRTYIDENKSRLGDLVYDVESKKEYRVVSYFPFGNAELQPVNDVNRRIITNCCFLALKRRATEKELKEHIDVDWH